MVVGVPKEIKPEENRIAIVPGGVETLVNKGHHVIIERMDSNGRTGTPVGKPQSS